MWGVSLLISWGLGLAQLCAPARGGLGLTRLHAAPRHLPAASLEWEPCGNSRPHPALPPRAALGGQGGLGGISAIWSTNREFRKGNHTKCFWYFKIGFFISFLCVCPAESQGAASSGSCFLLEYFFFIFIKIPFFFF